MRTDGITSEYDTKGGNKVKVLQVNAEHKTVTIQDKNGNCQAFIWNTAKAIYEHKISHFDSGRWAIEGTYREVAVGADGTVIARSLDGRMLVLAPDGKETLED